MERSLGDGPAVAGRPPRSVSHRRVGPTAKLLARPGRVRSATSACGVAVGTGQEGSASLRGAGPLTAHAAAEHFVASLRRSSTPKTASPPARVAPWVVRPRLPDPVSPGRSKYLPKVRSKSCAVKRRAGAGTRPAGRVRGRGVLGTPLTSPRGVPTLEGHQERPGHSGPGNLGRTTQGASRGGDAVCSAQAARGGNQVSAAGVRPAGRRGPPHRR